MSILQEFLGFHMNSRLLIQLFVQQLKKTPEDMIWMTFNFGLHLFLRENTGYQHVLDCAEYPPILYRNRTQSKVDFMSALWCRINFKTSVSVGLVGRWDSIGIDCWTHLQLVPQQLLSLACLFLCPLHNTLYVGNFCWLLIQLPLQVCDQPIHVLRGESTQSSEVLR